MNLPYLEINGVNIFYQDSDPNSTSNQKTIIFIHGAGENSNLWKFQFSELSKYFRIISIDLPGHANSSAELELSMDLYLKCIDKLILHLDRNKITLAGHSMGGAICMSYFLKYDNVDSLILIGTGAKLKVSSLIFESLQSDFNSAINQISSIAMYSKSKPLIEFVKAESLRTTSKTYIADFNICNKFDIMDQVKKITVPTLIICGEKDLLTPQKYSIYLNEKIKKSILQIIPNAGHDVHIEKSSVINQIIKNFVESI
ncbi:MAG: alpha/beta fold hydrolase [Candidatus Helarchaeota archaeon]